MTLRILPLPPCLLALLVAASPGVVTAQPSGYWAPGAVELIEQDDVEEFPDSRTSRAWLMGFRNGLFDACEEPIVRREADAMLRAGAGPVAGMRSSWRYMTTSIQLAQGIEDGTRWVAAHGCESREPVATTVMAIIYFHGSTELNRGDEQRFIKLVNPAARAALGFDPDGRATLRPEMERARDELVLPVERFLRGRLSAEMGEEELREVATEVATAIVRSGISRESLRHLQDADYDGNPVLHLQRITQRAHGLAPEDRGPTPFGPAGDPLISLAEDMWGDIFAAFENLRTDLENMGVVERALRPEQESELLLALADEIRQVLPPELSTALDWYGAASGPPVNEPAAEQALRDDVFGALRDGGVINEFNRPGAYCRIETSERFDRLLAGGVSPGVSGEVSFYAATHPTFKLDDDFEYTINNTPRARGESHRFTVDVRDLAFGEAERETTGECLRIRVPVRASSPGAKYDHAIYTQMPRRDQHPTESSSSFEEASKSRSPFVDIHMEAERAESALELMRDYARRLEVVAAGGADPGSSVTVAARDADDRSGFESNPVTDLPAPGETGASTTSWSDDQRIQADTTLARLAGQPTFTPFTQAAQPVNREEFEAALRDRPALEQDADAGHQERVGAWVLVDTEGRVVAVHLSEPSQQAALNEVAIRSLRLLEFTPAMNRDATIPVWIQMPLTFGPGGG